MKTQFNLILFFDKKNTFWFTLGKGGRILLVGHGDQGYGGPGGRQGGIASIKVQKEIFGKLQSSNGRFVTCFLKE